MRYLVMARVKPGMGSALARAVDEGTLGKGSVAGDEYLNDMEQARLDDDGTVRWVEVCFCPTPLVEERPYWEEYFELLSVKDAHSRKNCRDLNGQEAWACCNCDCTNQLEERLARRGNPFLKRLRSNTREWAFSNYAPKSSTTKAHSTRTHIGFGDE
jgi:hypothetical protein